jgi:hypothetical protein
VVEDDGGREAAGYPSVTDKDCVTRAIAIGTTTPYGQIHDLVDAEGVAHDIPDAAENGPPSWLTAKILGERGWATIQVRQGARLTEADLPVKEHKVLIVETMTVPTGKSVECLIAHVTVVVDGVVRDIATMADATGYARSDHRVTTVYCPPT